MPMNHDTQAWCASSVTLLRSAGLTASHLRRSGLRRQVVAAQRAHGGHKKIKPRPRDDDVATMCPKDHHIWPNLSQPSRALSSPGVSGQFLTHAISKATRVTLTEMLPRPDQLWLTTQSGVHVSEFRILFTRKRHGQSVLRDAE